MRTDYVLQSHRLSGQIKRYHAWPTIREQTVGEHVFQVMRIYCDLFGSPRPGVWRAILEHDMPEIVMGDVPFSGRFATKTNSWSDFKSAMHRLEDEIRNLLGITAHEDISEEERLQIKICDMLECWEAGLDEHRLGSQYGLAVMRNVLVPVLRLCSEQSYSTFLDTVHWLRETLIEGGELFAREMISEAKELIEGERQ